ncbi:hypothetical protein FVR03_23005 [Pontibacter qinzhouensis]|uniref:Uncharacterized protein n=1 Tax=Pontibacter qinzhouensis TaxID=2603253 RepID=A0A5C8ILM8_9BACT|nr:hypothetical protein [Pontibacter qinzhouensis]TXK22428.1 hypothetical protein FVR03_23005 [Pontibacter qinzhouensis]
METPAFDFYDKQGVVQLSEEEVKDLLQAKRDFLEGKTTARPWEEIKAKMLNKRQIKPSHSQKNACENK